MVGRLKTSSGFLAHVRVTFDKSKQSLLSIARESLEYYMPCHYMDEVLLNVTLTHSKQTSYFTLIGIATTTDRYSLNREVVYLAKHGFI